MKEIPSMFVYNAICVMSDQMTSKAGTITSGEDRFMEWKTVDGSYENTRFAQFDTFFEGLFQKQRLLDILKNFICFSNNGKETVKILAGYHQYFAVKKPLNLPGTPLLPTVRAAYSGIRRGAANHCPWSFTPTSCKRLWKVRPSLFLPTGTTWTTSYTGNLPNARAS